MQVKQQMSWKWADVSIKANARPSAFVFLSLYTWALACVEIIQTETENSTNCISFMHVLTSTLISTWHCNLNKKKNWFLFLCLCLHSFFFICVVYLAGALFTLAIQAQAHKCRIGIKMCSFILWLRLCLRRNYAKKAKDSRSIPRSKMSSRWNQWAN